MKLLTEHRLQQIIERNDHKSVYGGMAGGVDVMNYMGSRQYFKRRAAEKLLYLRENRDALEALGFGRHEADASLLAKIAHFRKSAATTNARGQS